MSELDERALHASLAGFIVWLTGQPVPAPVRHEYPPVVDRYLRWRHDGRTAGHADADAFLAALAQRHAPRYQRELAADVLHHYATYLSEAAPGR